MYHSLLVALLLLSHRAAGAAVDSWAWKPVNTSSLEAVLNTRLSPGSEFFLATDANYSQQTTQRWTVYGAPSYVAAVKPALESDVAETVKIAAAFNLPFLATGGGHGYTTSFDDLNNGISIDLSAFRSVSVDAAANTMTVGGAVRFNDVFDPLYAAGKEIQTGSCSCVGMVGATIGGGVGRYQGLHGLILDALLSVRMVTAKGDIIVASKTENKDLFWGMRGAGANFGIVVSATYQVQDLTNGGQILNADLIFTANSTSAHWELLKTISQNQPAEVALVNVILYDPALGPVVLLNFVYIGPEEEGMALLQPFIDNNPVVQNISVIPWNRLSARSFLGTGDAINCVKGDNRNLYGMGVKNFDVPTFENYFSDMVTFYETYPDARGSNSLIELYATQAVLAVPDKDTVYPHREITTQLLFQYIYPNSTLDEPINAFARKVRSNFDATSGFDELAIYVNYGHGDEGPVAWYAMRNLKKLRALKEKWDPRRLFRFNNPF